MTPKHYNNGFILLLSHSRQSKLHFGTITKFVVACVTDLTL